MNATIDTKALGIVRHPQYKPLSAVPATLLVELSVKLYALCNLAWEYTDTILDVCIAERISQTKPLVRAVRDLKRSYDRFRSSSLNGEYERKETERGNAIEEYLEADFDRLFYSLYNDISRMKLTEPHRRLVIAVQQAMTILDAVKIYARRCDRAIERYGTAPIEYSMVQTEVIRLWGLIPQFAGDCYSPGIQSRKITAAIIARKLDDFIIETTKQ